MRYIFKAQETFTWERGQLMANPYLATVIWWAVFFALVLVALKVFDVVTPFKVRQETREKNPAVGAVQAGLLVGMALIVYSAIVNSETILMALLYAVLGLVLMLVSYYVYDLMSPEQVNKELDEHNLLVGYKIAGLFVAIGLVVAASIV
ncbi:MAG: DUF350 domain-containing protein [Clostridia bacterium]|nr:MAG: DUF350 domain-containing protein [Clostridia bacterium]